MFSRDVLEMDLAQEADAICAALRNTVTKTLLRRGIVVGVSGGIDSSTTLGLAVKAFGPKRGFGILMPERDSSDARVDLRTGLGAN